MTLNLFSHLFFVLLQLIPILSSMKKQLYFIISVSMLMLSPVLHAQTFTPSIEQRKLSNVFSAINALYVDTINEKKMVESAINGILKELDPHSSFIPKEEVERVNEPLEGSFEGVGIQFQMFDDTLLVVQVISGCPAEKVGIQAGDRIIYINDELIAGVKMRNSDIMKKLRGPKGSEVQVKIKRNFGRELILFKIIRDKIPIHSVDASYMVTGDIGFIKINNFGNNTVEEYQKAFAELKKAGMKHLILSLQGNGGGYLNAAIQLADEFLERDQLIVYTEGLRQAKNIANASSIGGYENGQLIILIDEHSASASEIVSGAIQDWDRGILVGRRSFGKGLVQRQIPLIDGSMLRLTTARYYTPTGRCIQKPYKDGPDKYENDLLERFKKGEFLHADSIHFPDSLKYQTLRQKRTVYGGGGIMPDIFIPIDTTKMTDFHRKVISQGIINKMVVQYIEKNRANLKAKYKTFDLFNASFQVDKAMMDKLAEMADNEKITYKPKEIADSEKMISLQIKALIARDLWTSNEFYKIIDTTNESLQEAIRILNTPGLYDKILKKK